MQHAPDLGWPVATEDPYETEAPIYEEPEPAATGPAGELDQPAADKGWAVDETTYGSASGFVSSICEELGEKEEGKSHPQWLVEGHYLDGDAKAVLQAGIPKLCPKSAPILKQVVSGKYDRWFGNGTYVVSSKAVEGEETISPGTYRAEGKMENCYWERPSESGEIIDNNFATSARRITMTIRASDGQFTSEECAAWKPVK
ncbi:hypothetical protein ACFQ7J_30455 [Streptomyces sp. NPDC056501]|uniref:hypothetical protein n=1 Tax=Streptomyces sp. NPDC056501 TaxID=3345841 RepID=UPI00368950AB